MCLAVPGKIIERKGETATVDFDGVRRTVNMSFLPEKKTRKGDYVLVHVGFAIQKVDKKTAIETYRLLNSSDITNKVDRSL